MPSTRFSQNHCGLIRIEGIEITAEQNQFRPGLIVPLHLSMNQIFSTTHDQCVLMDVHAILLGGAQSVELSTAERQPLPRTIGTGQEFDLKLHFPLDTRRAVEIEKLRQTDVLISFSISPILAGIEIMAAKKDGANIGRTCHFLTANFEGPNATLSINIPQSHWVRNILPHLNVAEYLLIEVPSKTSKKLLSAWQHVEKAEASYLNRDMKGAFAYCREAGDAIDTTLQQELGENSFAFAERWGRSHKLFSNLSSLYLHIEEKKGKYEPDTVTLEKADLENVLFIAKSLVRFAEHLLATSTKQIPSKPNN